MTRASDAKRSRDVRGGGVTLEHSPGTGDREIDALGPWFHNLHLPDGRQTAPKHKLGDFPRSKWTLIAPHLPEDLTGWRALDIGCNAGFYSFALAERGAEVLGIDVDEHYLRQANWAKARFEVGDRVRFERRGVYDLARMEERFDLVWFMGVFYHLRYPLLGLDLAAGKASRTLVFQSLGMPGEETIDAGPDLGFHERDRMHERGWPKIAFIEHRLAGDPTNWWAPNHACMEAMLRSAGLTIEARPGHEIYVARPDESDSGRERRSRAIEAAREATWASASAETARNGSARSNGRANGRRGQTGRK